MNEGLRMTTVDYNETGNNVVWKSEYLSFEYLGVGFKYSVQL